MTTATHPPPAASLPPAEPDPDAGLDLDTRILRAEQRLMAREEHLRLELQQLTERVQQGLHPRRLLKPALGGAAAVLTLWLLLRGRKATPGVRRGVAMAQGPDTDLATHAPGGHGRMELPWVRLLGLAWPLMPARLRDRVSPATASTVLSLGLPLAEKMLARRVTPPLATVPQLDLQRYAGTWFEVARLPALFEGRCAGQPRARYVPQLDGSLAVTNRCVDDDGQVHDVDGEARPVPGSGGARLRVSLWPAAWRWLPPAWSDYWVLHVDADYSEALVGTPDRSGLWLLSRRPQLAPERLQALVQLALDRGFAVDKLHFNAPAQGGHG